MNIFVVEKDDGVELAFGSPNSGYGFEIFGTSQKEKLVIANKTRDLLLHLEVFCGAVWLHDQFVNEDMSQIPEHNLIPIMNDLLYKIIGGGSDENSKID